MEMLKQRLEGRMEKGKAPVTRLKFKKLDKVEIIEKLNLALASYAVHYQKLRNFHWNVKGGDFFDIHEKFEEQYNDAAKTVDLLAERIRVYGHTPFSTFIEFINNSIIKESSTDLTSYEMVKSILRDYKILIEQFKDLAKTATEQADFGTEEIAKQIITKLEKNHWMFTSYIA